MKNILKSKTAKTITRILFVLFLVTVYCNIGWWYGKTTTDAQAKYFYKKSLNSFDKALLGDNKFLREESKEMIAKGYSPSLQTVAVMFWPVIFIIVSASWFLAGIIWTLSIVMAGVVWLFNFVFGGGFFRLIGSVF